MKLYSAPISPYASRCRVQIYHKNLPVEIVPPPGGMGSDEVKARNPNGKIPVLEIGDDSLAESWAIMVFLENCHPEPAMRSGNALDVAKQVELVRFADLYLAPAMFPMFLALRGAADQKAVAAALDNQQKQLAILDKMLAERSINESLDLADAALLPIVWYGRILHAHFGEGDALANSSTVQAWWDWASSQEAGAKVLAEMEAGLKAAIPVLFS